jgi:membrane peptidoglycan carboxypeptidase
VTLGIGLALAAFSVAYAMIDVPDPNEQATAQSTRIYWSDGKTLMATIGEANRQAVTIGTVPVHVQKAVLAAEDRGFYEHGGLSPKGIARAVLNNVRGGDAQGGSTITQQMVKNYYLTQDQTLTRKIREAVVSLKMEQTLSKDQILEDYLNTIYFGRDSYGIQAASRAYYGKDVSKLSVSEGAMLAAIIRNPGLYNPETHLDRLEGRWHYVVDGMVSEGWLTQAEADSLAFEEPKTRKPSATYAGTNGYLIQTVKNELDALGFDEDTVNRGGLKVVTTFDRKAQRSAVEAVDEQRPKEKSVRVGLASVDPASGAVRAMYGGRDYLKQQYNDATQSRAQAGSTFKPFALATGLDHDIGLNSVWNGANHQTFKNPGCADYRVTNYGGESFGRITLLQGTEDSVNAVYVPMSIEAGTKDVAEMAHRLGIPEDVPIDGCSTVALGTASPTALEMAGAYATFADGGLVRTPFTVVTVTAPGGGVLYEEHQTGRQELRADVVADVSYALQKVVTSGSGFAARELGRPSAGKTGTTNDGLSAWYVGYTPQLSTAVVLFRPDKDGNLRSLDGVGGLSTVTGGSFPARIWTAAMRGALEGTEVVPFPKAAFIGGQPSVSPTTSPTPKVSKTTSPSPTPTPTPSGTPTDEPTPTPTPTESEPPAASEDGTPDG